MRNMHDLMRCLMAEDFAVYETALYLDGHPDDREALAYFREHKREAEELRERLTDAGYPLTFTDTPNGRYAWVTAPWPWQKGGC